MVRDEKDFELIVIAQGQQQNIARAVVGLLPEIGALLFDQRKLHHMTRLRIDAWM